MSTFLGPVGSLIPVKCASQLTSSGGREVAFARTLGKQKAFLGRVTAREWSVDIGLATPGELSGLRWLAENVNTPMVWYGPDAVVGNILPPAQAGLVPGTHNGLEGPLVEVEPGVHVKSALSDSGTSIRLPYRDGALEMLPVVRGAAVTVSGWVRGSSTRISLFWRDADGETVGSDLSQNHTFEALSRLHFTVVPPRDAELVEIRFVNAELLAGPAVTLTDRVMPYSPGKGATSVVAHDLSDAVIRATEDQQLGSLSFTVSEVG